MKGRNEETEARAVAVPPKRAWTRWRPVDALIVVENEPVVETRAATLRTVFHLRPALRWTTSWTEPEVAPETRPETRTLPRTRETFAVALPYLLQSEAQAASDNSYVLIEATSNQVDQFGGYTGLRPPEVRDMVLEFGPGAPVPEDEAMTMQGEYGG